MILIDTELAKRVEQNNPVRVAIVGAGYMARCIAVQIVTATPGMRLVAVSNRTRSKAERVYAESGITDVVHVDTTGELEKAIAANRYAVTDDYSLVCEAGPTKWIASVRT